MFKVLPPSRAAERKMFKDSAAGTAAATIRRQSAICFFCFLCFRKPLPWASQNERPRRCDCAHVKPQIAGVRLNSGNARNAAAPCLRIRFAQPAVIIGADRCLVLAHKIGSADLQFAMFCIIAEQLSLRKESQRTGRDRQAASPGSLFSFCISLGIIANFPLS